MYLYIIVLNTKEKKSVEVEFSIKGQFFTKGIKF